MMTLRGKNISSPICILIILAFILFFSCDFSDDEEADDEVVNGTNLCDLNKCSWELPSEPTCLDTVEGDGLEWTACDNGDRISFYCAACYAENLTLKDHSDWQLPTIDQLKSLFDPNNEMEAECNLFVSISIVEPFQPSCSKFWSRTLDTDLGTTEAYYFDFENGKTSQAFDLEEFRDFYRVFGVRKIDD